MSEEKAIVDGGGKVRERARGTKGKGSKFSECELTIGGMRWQGEGGAADKSKRRSSLARADAIFSNLALQGQ